MTYQLVIRRPILGVFVTNTGTKGMVGNIVLNKDKVASVRFLLILGATHRDCASWFQVSPTVICNINLGKCGYAHEQKQIADDAKNK